MKKFLVKLVAGIIVLIVIAVVVVSMNMNSIIKKAIETGGPEIAKVSVSLEGLNVSLLSGKGELRGLVIGNPEGFKSESAVKVGLASLQVKPASVFSDKVVVRTFNLQAPEITIEGGLDSNNLKKIAENVEAATGSDKTKAESAEKKEKKPGKKIQVDEFIIRDGKVNVRLNVGAGITKTVPLPNVELRDLGTGPEGIAPADLTKVILNSVLKDVVKVAGPVLEDLGKQAVDTARAAGEKVAGEAMQKAGEKADEAAKGLKGLFKKDK
jgi:uncharacterized protein involved in outer membrane biogenesis